MDKVPPSGWPRRRLIRAPCKESHRDTAEGRAGRHHQNPLVSAYKGVSGNEKADEWAKLAVKEPDARGSE